MASSKQTLTIEKAEPELAADLIDNGVHICGGASLLRGMDTVVGRKSQIVSITKNKSNHFSEQCYVLIFIQLWAVGLPNQSE